MNAELLSAEEQRAYGFTHRIKVTHEDLTETTAATDQVIPLLSVAAGALVTRCATRLVTPFNDASDVAYNDTQVSVGDGGSAARFLAAQQVNENGTEVLAKGGTGTLHAYEAADTVDLTVAHQDSKALADLDAGELWVFLHVQDLDGLI